MANTNAGLRGGCIRSSVDAAVMVVERRDAQELPTGVINLQKDELPPKAKPFRLCLKSRMRRESHVRFCESLGVKLPRATRPESSGTVPS